MLIKVDPERGVEHFEGAHHPDRFDMHVPVAKMSVKGNLGKNIGMNIATHIPRSRAVLASSAPTNSR